MPSPDTRMKQRLADLKLTITRAGETGINLIALVNRFGCDHGLRTDTVKLYIRMLETGGYIIERNNRVYEAPKL